MKQEESFKDGIIRSPDTLREQRVPPGQRLTEGFPVLHYHKVPEIDTSRWTFSVFGLVKQRVELTYQQFLRLPRVKVFSDIHCVTGWSRLNNLWEGVCTSAVKDIAELLPEARFVMVHAGDGYTTNLSLDDFFQPDVLFAIKHDGEQITPEHGYPIRLIVPRLYIWKGAKWVTGVEFMPRDKPGLWESHGYHNHGDPWLEQRYSSR
jgi:DMSO/TMAO reductase YedYZ molybdopterin-dependent catalytic subunit